MDHASCVNPRSDIAHTYKHPSDSRAGQVQLAIFSAILDCLFRKRPSPSPPDSFLSRVTLLWPQWFSGSWLQTYYGQKQENPIDPAMCRENEQLVIPQSVFVSSSQILYPVLCLVCLLLLVQRFRRRRAWFARFGRQMDSRKSLPERPGGKETAGTAVGQESKSNRDVSPNFVAPLPSASDVLRPLSHCTPLPPSGHLAAALSQERQAGNRPSLTRPETPKESSSPGPISTRSVSSGQVPASESHRRPCQSAGEEARSSPNHRGLSPSSSGAPVMNLQQNSSTGISTASHGRQPSPGASGSGAVQSVQRHSETTHHLYDVDEQGVRTWKRQVVEYR